MSNSLVKLLGWRATILHGDPTTYDRWMWLKRYLQPGKLRTLDAGCGSGSFAMFAAKVGNESLGISFDERNFHIAEKRSQLLRFKNVQFILGDLRKLDKYSGKLGTFDQIICFETIEHILNDKKLIADLAKMLRPEGRLLLTTPYKHYKPLYGDEISDHEDGGHVRWGYTFDELRDLFISSELELIVEDHISGFFSQKITNLMRRLSLVIPHSAAWVMTLPLRLFQIIDAPFTRFIRYPFLSVGVVGIKRK